MDNSTRPTFRGRRTSGSRVSMSAATVVLHAPGKRRTSLAVRITALCFGVAGVVALVAGTIATRQVTAVAEQVSRAILANQADVLAGQLNNGGVGARNGLPRIVGVLGGHGIGFVSLPAGGVPAVRRGAGPADRRAGQLLPQRWALTARCPRP
jgi:hypothetical protein